MLGGNNFLTFFFLYICDQVLIVSILAYLTYALKHMNSK
jgi:hypothetical protein